MAISPHIFSHAFWDYSLVGYMWATLTQQGNKGWLWRSWSLERSEEIDNNSEGSFLCLQGLCDDPPLPLPQDILEFWVHSCYGPPGNVIWHDDAYCGETMAAQFSQWWFQNSDSPMKPLHGKPLLIHRVGIISPTHPPSSVYTYNLILFST